MKQPKKILFILHEDTKSGAPKVILDLIKHLQSLHPNEFIINLFIFNKTGEYHDEFKKTSNKIFSFPTFKNKIIKTLIEILSINKLYLLYLAYKNNYDIIYGNTVSTLKSLYQIKKLSPKAFAILHVHESEYLCNLFLEIEQAKVYLQEIDKIICVSKFTKKNLIENYKSKDNLIEVVYPFIELNNISKEINSKIEAKYKGNVELLMTNIGNPHLTKGTDLIPQIAVYLKEINPELKFKILIIGNKLETEYIKAIRLDIKKLNLGENIIIINHVPDPIDYLKISDLYIIPSREDSFSLMGIYANYLNIPTISFKNNGGLSEVFNNEKYIQVDYLNTQKFAEAIICFTQNRDKIMNIDYSQINKFFEEQLVLNYKIISQSS